MAVLKLGATCILVRAFDGWRSNNVRSPVGGGKKYECISFVSWVMKLLKHTFKSSLHHTKAPGKGSQ